MSVCIYTMVIVLCVCLLKKFSFFFILKRALNLVSESNSMQKSVMHFFREIKFVILILRKNMWWWFHLKKNWFIFVVYFFLFVCKIKQWWVYVSGLYKKVTSSDHTSVSAPERRIVREVVSRSPSPPPKKRSKSPRKRSRSRNRHSSKRSRSRSPIPKRRGNAFFREINFTKKCMIDLRFHMKIQQLFVYIKHHRYILSISQRSRKWKISYRHNLWIWIVSFDMVFWSGLFSIFLSTVQF